MKRKLLPISAAALLVLGVAAPVQAASQHVKHDPNQGYNIVVSGVATV